ncbi:MAG: hypothetical protein K0S63_1396 [Gammaproteobacteria bacterium]|nr:hypothetical protein [Gammaproteobacteria bacterium]
MRVKPLVAIIASSLLAVSVSHASVPSSSTQLIADDMPIDNSQNSVGSPTVNPGARSGMPSVNSSGNTDANSGAGSANNMGNTGADEGTSDTATGSSDDSSDY